MFICPETDDIFVAYFNDWNVISYSFWSFILEP